MYVCRKMRLCNYLLQQGFTYIKQCIDKDNPKFNIWLFKNTPELHIAIEEYYSKIPKN